MTVTREQDPNDPRIVNLCVEIKGRDAMKMNAIRDLYPYAQEIRDYANEHYLKAGSTTHEVVNDPSLAYNRTIRVITKCVRFQMPFKREPWLTI